MKLHSPPAHATAMAGLFKSRYVAVVFFFFVALATTIFVDVYGLVGSFASPANGRCSQPPLFDPSTSGGGFNVDIM